MEYCWIYCHTYPHIVAPPIYTTLMVCTHTNHKVECYSCRDKDSYHQVTLPCGRLSNTWYGISYIYACFLSQYTDPRNRYHVLWHWGYICPIHNRHDSSLICFYIYFLIYVSSCFAKKTNVICKVGLIPIWGPLSSSFPCIWKGWKRREY